MNPDLMVFIQEITCVIASLRTGHTHVINLDEYKSEGPHWIALYLKL